MERKSEFSRKSKETEITATVNIDGSGETRIQTQIAFLDHMIELFAFHGCFDLNIEVEKSDIQIDIHHTNEDVGIVLGKLFKKALGELGGINRFGTAFAPMEDTLGRTVIDISGRGFLTLKIGEPGEDVPKFNKEEGYAMNYLEHFLESFAHGIGATMNVQLSRPNEDIHTNIEAVFKSLGLALKTAVEINPARKGLVPSTKGIID